MPIYEFQCEACGETFESLRKLADPPLDTCRLCGDAPVRRLMSAPAFRLKGGGWYETDFKSGDKQRNVARGDGEQGSSGSNGSAGNEGSGGSEKSGSDNGSGSGERSGGGDSGEKRKSGETSNSGATKSGSSESGSRSGGASSRNP